MLRLSFPGGWKLPSYAMAGWPLVFVVVAFAKILTVQNVTVGSLEEESLIPDLHGDIIQDTEPEQFCSSHSCINPWIKDHFCRCDDMCAYYGDCCWDVTNATGEFRQSHTTFQCRSFPGLSSPWGVNNKPGGYLTVSRCPNGTKKEIVEQCEREPNATSYVKAEMFLPIRDKDEIIYKNIYCARCNGVGRSSMSIWKTSHHCPTCPSSLDISLEHKVQLSGTNCFLIAYSLWWNLRSCSKGLVDSCPNDFNDNDIIAKCHSYLSPGTWNLTWYKNPHCAICNGVHLLWDYLCAPVPAGEKQGPPRHSGNSYDIFGGVLLPYPPTIMDPRVPVKVEIHEIIRLSECTTSYPLHVYLEVRFPNDQLQNHSCPYFGKRLEKCFTSRMQWLLEHNIGLPWRQIVKFPNTDPFPSESTLLFHIPPSFTQNPYFELWIPDIVSLLMDSKNDCDFQDLYLLRVCGNLSSPEEGIALCRSLLEFNSSHILARVSNNTITEFLDPSAMNLIEDVSWYAFKARLSGNKLQVYKTEICQLEQRRNLTDNDRFGKPAWHPPSLTRRRLTPVELIFGNICISLSITCLLVTFITYCVFPSLRNSFGIILMNFVGAFALAQLLIHFVTDNVTHWQVICKAAAIVTHFFWLVTYAWMNLLAWNLKSTFGSKNIRTLNYIPRKTMICYFCYGWIVPLCIVAILCTFSFFFSDKIPITYGLIKGVTCWIGNDWLAFSVLIGPLAGAIAVNGVLFSLIIIGIRRSRFRPKDPQERLRNDWSKMEELLIYIKISLFMGFIWIIGFFIILDKSRILLFTYYGLQTLQGILIMLLFAFSRRVRSLWRSKFGFITERSIASRTTGSTA